MIQRIRSNWDAKTENSGDVGVRFRITRNGTLVDPMVERSSGVFVLDQNALRALVATRQLPPLPEAYTNPDLGVHIIFEYRR
jgi:TonB family protein